MTPKQWYSVKAADKSADVYIYDEIGSGFFGGVSAKQFVEDLKGIGKVDTINVFINSPGGDVFDGVTIYNALKRNSAEIAVHIDGLAASIASIIAMAGDSITIADNGMMMIHQPWTFAMGNAAEMRKQADVLDQVAGTLISTYVSRTGADEAKVKALMDAETWFNADDAVKEGFADKKSDPVKMAAHFDLSRFKNAPKKLPFAAKAPETANKPPETPAIQPLKLQIADHERWLLKSRKEHNHPLAK